MRVALSAARRRAALTIALAMFGGLAMPRALAATGGACSHPVLVLTAMPLELNPLVAKAKLDPTKRVDVAGKKFYAGRLAGNDVVLAMTGIGPANATHTAEAAFSHFKCTFGAAVFSGVAGSRYNIGDVTVPARWTSDGKSWLPANPYMLRIASTLNRGNVKLSQDVPVGDAACACPGVDAATPVHMPQPAQIYVGGDGETSDPFGGHAVPCLGGGGDIAGCAPCIIVSDQPEDAANFAANAPTIADPTFWEALFGTQTATTDSMDAQDEETAAVAAVAAKYKVPFLGVRAVSDGQNDPLHLPGFPFQFAVYRQLAGNNAAAVTIAFLDQWGKRRHPHTFTL
jgi:nucleoside phosphorylase